MFSSDGNISLVRHVENLLSQHSIVIQHSRGGKHIADIVSLKNQPGRQYLIGESSVTSSS